jgi:hypothetical protein
MQISRKNRLLLKAAIAFTARRSLSGLAVFTSLRYGGALLESTMAAALWALFPFDNTGRRGHFGGRDA